MQHFDKCEGLQKELQQRGYDVDMPYKAVDESNVRTKKECIEDHIAKLRQSDALVVANYDDERSAGYIGPSTFFEIGWAYALNKIIYLLNPPDTSSPFHEDTEAAGCKIINQDISKIGGNDE